MGVGAVAAAGLIALGGKAGAGLVPAINAVRSAGCGGRPGLASPLRADGRLESAARRLAAGDGLEGALAAVRYRAVQAASIALTNVDATALPRALADGSCTRILDPAMRDVGVREDGNRIWIVLAAPLVTDELRDPAQVRRRVLELVNTARATSRRCGGRSFAAAPPLRASGVLATVADAHARDMAARDRLGHEGGDGAGPGDRATRAGYAWREVGENVASGSTTAADVVDGWLGSPGHCANLMHPGFVETGIGVAVDTDSEGGVYWAQLFAIPAP